MEGFPAALLSMILLIRTLPDGAPLSRPTTRLVSVTEAKTLCQRFPIKHDNELASFMRRYSINSIWLGLVRNSSEWNWVNSEFAVPPISVWTKDEPRCGILNHAGHLGHLECSQYLSFICELEGSCYNTYSVTRCISVSNSSFLIGPRGHSWYAARSLCQTFGGDLAVLSNHVKTRAAFLLANRTFTHTSFWIGLRNHYWTNLHTKEQVVLQRSQWTANQPSNIGRCVVLERFYDIASRRVAKCSASHSVICSWSDIMTERQITLTVREKENLKYPYIAGEGTFQEAVEACRPNEIYLPSDEQSLTRLYKHMLHLKLKSVWLPIRRKTSRTWTWNNQQEYLGKQVGGDNTTDSCGTLDLLLKTMYRNPCHLHDAGLVCLLKGGQQCSGTYQETNCFALDNSIFLAFKNVKSWYISHEICRNVGGSLAVFKDSNIIERLSEAFLQNDDLTIQNFFYTALISEEWTLPDGSAWKRHNMWHENEPKADRNCVVMAMDKNGIGWKAADCADSYAIVCTSLTTTPFTMSTKTVSYNASEIPGLYNLESSTLPPEEKLDFTVLLSAAASGLCIVVIFFVICVFKFRRRRRKNRKPETRYELKVQPGETDGLLKEDVQRCKPPEEKQTNEVTGTVLWSNCKQDDDQSFGSCFHPRTL